MIKNMKNWLNESLEEGTRIIFKDICKDNFDGDYEKMVKWLNEKGKTQRAYFVSENNKIIYNSSQYQQKYWNHAKRYSRHSDPVRVNIEFDNGQSGGAHGLIYLDPIDLPNQKPPRIRWYKNGRLSND